MKTLAVWSLGAILVVVGWLAVRGQVAPAVLLTWFGGAACFAWLLALVTLPWNLHFRARRLSAALAAARERGVVVPADRDVEATRLARRTLAAALAAHVVSAGVAAAVAFVGRASVGWYFSAFFLVSIALRPLFEYYRHVSARVGALLEGVRYPHDDVVALRARVTNAEAELGATGDRLTALTTRVEGHEGERKKHARATERELDALGRRFEETVDRLTDNQEVVRGLRAFLRLVSEQRAAALTSPAP